MKILSGKYAIRLHCQEGQVGTSVELKECFLMTIKFIMKKIFFSFIVLQSGCKHDLGKWKYDVSSIPIWRQKLVKFNFIIVYNEYESILYTQYKRDYTRYIKIDQCFSTKN